MTPAFPLLVYPVKDLPAARALYERLLGVAPYVDSPYYVGFRVGEQEVGLDPNGHKTGGDGPIAYRKVEDIQRSLRALLEAGARPHQEPQDVGGGRLRATVKDADGNLLGLLQG